tara:strand:+ start:1103 stop:1948 length:846 start_codon:yes stop_codon:yes gene_type:complete
MTNFFISFIIFAISYGYSFGVITSDIGKFCVMNAGSFIDEHCRSHNMDSNTLYSMSFIQYPADIKSHQIFIQKSFDTHIISSSLNVLNYGILEEKDGNMFSAADQKLELSLFNIKSESFIYGVSAGYVTSQIDNYSSSLLTYNIGFKKHLINKRLAFGFSIEDYNYVIEDFSNIQESYLSLKKVITEFQPRFLKAHIMFDYIYKNSNHYEYILGIKKYINNFFNIYFGKHFYSSDTDNINIFNNVSTGFSLLINNNYKINFGIQHLADRMVNIGTSLSIIK